MIEKKINDSLRGREEGRARTPLRKIVDDRLASNTCRIVDTYLRGSMEGSTAGLAGDELYRELDALAGRYERLIGMLDAAEAAENLDELKNAFRAE